MAKHNRNHDSNDFNNDRDRNRDTHRNRSEWDRQNMGSSDRYQDWDQSNYNQDMNRYSSDRQNFGDAGFDRDFQNDYNTRAGYSGNYGVGNRGEYRGNDQLNQWNDRNRGKFGDDNGYGLGSSDQNRVTSNWQNDRRSGDSNRWNSNHGGSNYGYGSGSRGGYDRDEFQRTRSSSNNNDRDWWDRTSDEVSSWFGDEEAERRRKMDKIQSGYHKGKGPKGYKRSDERIKEDVNDRLADDPYVDASEIDIDVTNSEVTLTGTVDSKQEKRRVEDLVEAISGVSNVENRLRVKSHSYSPASNSGLNTGLNRDKDIR